MTAMIRRIEIHPIFDDGAPYYKTTVFDVETNETGQTISTVSDIFHMNSLEQSIAQLARIFPE
jgi:hypothetical protein